MTTRTRVLNGIGKKWLNIYKKKMFVSMCAPKGSSHTQQGASGLKRHDAMLAKSRALFIKEYNNKLFNWLVTSSLVMVAIGRFVSYLKSEYTRMFWSAESLYYNPAWHIICFFLGNHCVQPYS